MATALAHAESWLLEPPPAEPIAVRAAELPARPLVAVIGLARRAGATTLARALAARLAAEDPARAAVVCGRDPVPSFAPATPAAARIAARLGDAHAAGRLCVAGSGDPPRLVASARTIAPVVFELAHDRSAAEVAELADVAVLVAAGDGEPALAELTARSLLSGGVEAVAVVSRPEDRARWHGRAALALPASRAGARLAAAGWEARGPLGAAVAELAEMCRAAVRA